MLNDFELQEVLRFTPQTRKTLLQEDSENLTEIHKITKRLYRLCHSNLVGRGVLVGKNRGETIFYSLQKEYWIVVVQNIMGLEYYYCKTICDLPFGEIMLKEAFRLEDNNWVEIGNKKTLRENVLEYY
jgi:hypothetical protein